MGRISCKDHLIRNFDHIHTYFDNFSEIYTYDTLHDLLDKLKEDNIALKTTKFSDLFIVLYQFNVLKELSIKMPQRKTKRFISGSPSVYKIAATLNQKSSYFSHLSAIYLNGLTEQLPKKIYTNLEQSPKLVYEKERLEQKNIDLAFSRAMRESNQIASFNWENNFYEVFLLSGKNQKNLGVKNIVHEGESLRCTGIERTLIDITVRPNYSGGVQQVLEAYTNAKNRVSVNKMLALYKKMDFVYPYHQLIGFYLEKAGYSSGVLDLLNSFDYRYDFYVTYQMKNKKFCPKWRVFYPEFLD